MIAEKRKLPFSIYEAHLSSMEQCTKKELSVESEVVKCLQGTGAAGGFA